MAEINVTPLVDVMLVILIVFMVSAPMMTTNFKVNLPRMASESLSPASQDKLASLSISVNKEGSFFLDSRPVNEAVLKERLKEIAQNNPQERVFIKADRGLAYGRVVTVMSMVRDAGLTRLSLVMELDTQGQDSSS